MAGILISAVVYFLAAYFIRRWLEDMGIRKGTTRASVVFVAAALVAYAAAYLVNLALA